MSAQIPAAPWAFRDFGGELLLVADHGRRRVVIAANPQGQLVTCNDRGVLEPITADHPIARAIEAAPLGIELAREIVAYFGDEPIEPFLNTDIRLRDLARALIAKAEGRAS